MDEASLVKVGHTLQYLLQDTLDLGWSEFWFVVDDAHQVMGHELEHQVDSVPLPALPITLVQDKNVLKPDNIFVVKLFEDLNLTESRDWEAFSFFIKLQKFQSLVLMALFLVQLIVACLFCTHL